MVNDGTESSTPPENTAHRSVTGSDSNGIDAVFDALADERRRFILRYVIDQSGGVGFDELANGIHNRETRSNGGFSERDDRERIRCALYHSHLPKLDDAGIVEFDRTHDTVHLTLDGVRLDLCRDLVARAGQ